MDKKLIAGIVITVLTLVGGYFGLTVEGCKVTEKAPVAVEAPVVPAN